MGVPPPPVRFAVVGLEHPHAYGITVSLLGAGAELVAFESDDEAAAADFAALFDGVRRAARLEEIVGDPTIDVVVPVGVPADRAAVAVAAMRAGKDVIADKPAATTLAQLGEVAAARDESGRMFTVWFSERVDSRATERASTLVGDGAIGEVVQVVGVGPHRLGLDRRPDWFLDPARAGGILADLATHQIDQFVHFAGAEDGDEAVEIVWSSVANFAHPEHPRFEDYGDVQLRTATASGSLRVDWYSPDGLPTWGDVRLFLLGTGGTIEVRKNIDLDGRPGGDHLLLVDGRETRRVDCAEDPLPFAGRFLADVRERSATHMAPGHSLRVCELALRAQVAADRRGYLVPEAPA